MIIPEDANTKLSENAPPPSATRRLTRPQLDRQAPIRNWSTLFTPPASAGSGASPGSGGAPPSKGAAGAPSPGGVMSPPAGAGAPASPAAAGIGQTVSDAVGQGYRVINEYLSQGQRYAEAMRWPEMVSSPPAASSGAAGQDPQQLLRRLMQYGADFAGMWFEVWSKLGWPAPGTWPAAAAAPGPVGSPGTAPPSGDPVSTAADVFSASTAAERAAAGAATAPSAAPAGPERVAVSVVSERRVQTVLELRRGAWTTLVAHALRPEGHEAPAIRGVKIDAREEQSLLRIVVEVPAEQPPGVYNGMLIDSESNLPRGTLTVTVEPPPGA